MSRIISLTSIPPRFLYLQATVDSLLKQNACDEIRINIPKQYRRFQEWDGSLPNLGSKINVVRCEEDWGPATKVLPTAMDHKNEDIQILFCDDDGLHPRNWARNLFECQSARPRMAVATWGRCIDEIPDIQLKPDKTYAKPQRIETDIWYRFERLLYKGFGYQPLYRPVKSAGFAQLLLGVGGVVVRPDFFSESSLDIPDDAFLVDDIWLSAQLAFNHVDIYCPRRFPVPFPGDGEKIEALFDMSTGGGRRKLNYNALIWCRENLNVW
jgi:hypothetical protein